jgi:hypothetical protein
MIIAMTRTERDLMYRQAYVRGAMRVMIVTIATPLLGAAIDVASWPWWVGLPFVAAYVFGALTWIFWPVRR